MTFSVQTLPQKVQDAFYNAIDWNVLYWTARRNGISDVNKLADILFYHAHKELVFPFGSVALKPGMANYNALVAEWKKFKQLAQSLSHGRPESYEYSLSQNFLDDSGIDYDDLIYGKPAEGWTSHALARKIEEAWGREVAKYCRKPPQSESRPSAAIFSLPNNVSSHLGTAIVWKCQTPRDYCRHGISLGKGHSKIMVIGLLRSDEGYWLRQTNNNSRKTEILSATAAAAVRDYRRCVVAQQMCPHSAYQRLYSISKDVTYQMFLGMFQLLSPQGASPVPGKMSVGGRSLGNPVSNQAKVASAVPDYVNKIVSFIED